MKLQDVINIFKGFKLITNIDISTCEVTQVTVLDAPDSINWVGKGEFVISSGYIYKDDPLRMVKLVENLSENKASAFGLKLDRYIFNLPEEVVKRASELNFPIVYVPENYSYAEIINPILYRVANDSYAIIKEIETTRGELTEMLVEGTSIIEILRYLNSIIKCNICFINNICHKTISYPQKLDMTKYIYKKEIHIKGELIGTVYFDKEYDDNQGIETASIEYSLTLINLLIQRELFEGEISENYKSELSIDLCNNNLLAREEIFYRSNLNNWAIKDGIQVIIYDIDDYKRATITKKYSEKLLLEQKNIFYRTILNNNTFFPKNRGYFKKSDSIVLMYSVDMNDNSVIEDFMSLVNKNKSDLEKNTIFEVTVGIGNYYSDILDTHKSYKTAMQAVKYGRIFKGNNSIHRYKDIRLFKNMFESYMNGIDGFNDNVIQKIRKYDCDNECNLEKTLISLIENDWNIAATSRDLFIHYNTVNYRYGKILEVLGKDSLNSNDRFLLHLYVKFDEIIRKNQINEG